jgi:dTDP-4-dehydrorhamnose reductase
MKGHPHILLIGRVGQVGWELRRCLGSLGTLTTVDYPEIDLTHPPSIKEWVEKVEPSVIVNAAAYTAVDKAESEPERAMGVNGEAPGILAKEAARLGALLVHYSTEYVYDGTKDEAYVETDRTAPLSAYGRSKLAGDEAIVASGCSHLIFRTCWVYGARGRNFLRTIQRLASERDELRIVDDQVGSPTWSRMIAEVTGQVLAQLSGRDGLSVRETYHLSALGHVSWCGFAQAVIEKLELPFDLKNLHPITTEEYPLPAPRPKNSVLSKDKLKGDFGIEPPDWEESLDLVVEEIKDGA